MSAASQAGMTRVTIPDPPRMDWPIPMPSECICLLPREMNAIYWKLYPDGTKMIPACVPRRVWIDHWKRMYPLERDIPDPPQLCRNYWGKFQAELEREADMQQKLEKKRGIKNTKFWDAHKKKKKVESDLCGRLSDMHSRFWEVYLSMFPRGHEEIRHRPHDFSVPAC